jgi:hypothetical protein
MTTVFRVMTRDRFPTDGALGLAKRFHLPFNNNMQDWPWEIADHSRFDEFLQVYDSEPLSLDERFTLMKMLIQCVENFAWEMEVSEVQAIQLKQGKVWGLG